MIILLLNDNQIFNKFLQVRTHDWIVKKGQQLDSLAKV